MSGDFRNPTRRAALLSAALPLAGAGVTAAVSRPPLRLYQPALKTASIYSVHPAADPFLRNSHDAEVVRFRGKYLAAWKAFPDEKPLGSHFNYVSGSGDFENWSRPVQAFTRAGGAVHPVEIGNSRADL